MRRTLVVSIVLTTTLAVAQPAGAVIGPLDGDTHPNVGVMVVSDAHGDWFGFCSGVLISPTVFLTNHNCPGDVGFARSIGGRAQITFDPVIWPPDQATWRTVEAAYVHPGANPANGTNLYGMAVLAKPVRGIMPAQLPTLQQLATMGQDRTLTVVGYGSNERRSATVTIAGIFPSSIRLLNNVNATGQGGACGDGGAPYFLGVSNIVVAVADGETGQCNAVSWAFRNDTETARSFLDDLVTLP